MFFRINECKIFLSIFLALFLSKSITAQVLSPCTKSISCGYSVNTKIQITSIVPSTTNCPLPTSGFNYNLRFGYTITVSGVNTCWNANLLVQVEILCGSSVNGFYSVSVPCRTVGAPSGTSVYTGTAVTTSNVPRTGNNCNSLLPSTLGCSNVRLNIVAGPGIGSSVTYTCALVPDILPVTLYDFNGALINDDNIELRWATASELNNHYFTLERSADAKSWQVVSVLNGNGTTSEHKNYKFTDSKFVNGINYYRLKQTDYDGTSGYSQIIAVDGSKNASMVSIYPNPVEKGFAIRNLQNNFIYAELVNPAGQVIRALRIPGNADIEINDLLPGLYILMVNGPNEKSMHKILQL